MHKTQRHMSALVRSAAVAYRVQLPDEQLLGDGAGITGVSDVLKALCGIAARVLPQDLLAARVLPTHTDGP